MKNCQNCGKSISILERKQIYNEETELYEYFCPKCSGLIKSGKITLPKNEEKTKEETLLKTEGKETLFIKKLLDVNYQQQSELQQMKSSIDTIKNILLVFFILFLIGLFLLFIGMV